ncbi:MAG: ABC transporter substrate-binding protein [Rhodospirillaceae bacterium]|nr:ABC transporter substrate-binding protein [Rhodospirillaceae bacterium]
MISIHKRTAIAAIAGAVMLGSSGLAQAQAVTVRTSVNPLVYSYLPIFLAVDKGYFKAQGLDVQVKAYRGSSTTQVPLLARGDQDIAPMVMGPGMFNQHTQGFGLKIVSAIAGSNAKWSDTSWIMVRTDVWKAKKPKTLADLRGMSVDGGPLGSPVNLLIREALKKAGLGMSDVKYSEKFKSPPAWIAAFKNKAIDVQAAVEPIVTMLEAQGLATRWKSYKDAVPWFQETYFAASPKFLKDKPDAAKKFLTAFLQGAKDVHATGGKWTPALLDTLAKWSKLPKKILQRIPGPAYAGYFGSIDRVAIDRQQAIWMKLGAVKKKVDVNAIIDTSYLEAARKMAGVK